MGNAPAAQRSFKYGDFISELTSTRTRTNTNPNDTQKPMLRAEVYARALRASQNRK